MNVPSCRPPIRVLIVDDDRMLREYLYKLLNRAPDMQVVGTADTGEQAVDASASLKPRVITMDLSLPIMDGLEATRRILAIRPDARIIILSACHTSEQVQQSWRAGALAYVLKLSASVELATAIRAVVAGKYYLSRAIDQSLANESGAASCARRPRNRRDDGRFVSVQTGATPHRSVDCIQTDCRDLPTDPQLS